MREEHARVHAPEVDLGLPSVTKGAANSSGKEVGSAIGKESNVLGESLKDGIKTTETNIEGTKVESDGRSLQERNRAYWASKVDVSQNREKGVQLGFVPEE